MKKYFCGIAAALTASTSLAQWEQSSHNQGFYAGAGISRLQYEQIAAAGDERLQTLEFNVGYWHNPLVSVDVRVGTSLGDEVVEVAGDDWEMSVRNYASVYWRPEVANNDAKLYGLLGYSRIDLEAAPLAGSSMDLTDSGPSFGAGIGFFYTKDVVLNLEWKQLVDADGFEVDGFTAGFDYRF